MWYVAEMIALGTAFNMQPPPPFLFDDKYQFNSLRIRIIKKIGKVFKGIVEK